MERYNILNTDINVSQIGLGTLQFGWWVDEQTSHLMLDYYTNVNGNLIDTADGYPTHKTYNTGRGLSEEIIGRWLKKSGKRHDVIIATKVGSRTGGGEQDEGLSYKHILKAVEGSLKRLQTGYIDLYQAHIDDQKTPLEETIKAFDNLHQRGLVRSIGCSNYSVKRLQMALKISQENSCLSYATLQPLYNLIERKEYEEQLQALCQREGVSVMPYMPLAKGFLAGKYNEQHELPSTPRASGVRMKYFSSRNWNIVRRVKQLAIKYSVSCAQISLAWLLSKPEVIAPIVGVSSLGQLDEIVKYHNFFIAEEDLKLLNETVK